MKIIYGVQGTGNGHITRARIMAKAFAQRSDVKVDFVFSGRDPNKYFDMALFGDYRTFHGFTFSTNNGSVNYWQSIKSAKVKQFLGDIKTLDLSSYDLLINDFEPVTAWAAKKHRLPSISISHQAAFCHRIPNQEMNIIDKFITRYFAPTDILLGIHWYHFGFPILPPFIEPDVTRESSDKTVLVYLPFEDIENIQTTLQSFAEYDFVSFHPEVTHAHLDNNIVWHPTSKKPFHKALGRCQGVIANAGFELASECLQLNKPMLLKPLAGQYEQISNAYTLAELGLCEFMRVLDSDMIEQWLQSKTPEGVQFSCTPNTLIDWLLRGQWTDTSALCTKLWSDVNFPPSVINQLSALES